LKLANPNLPLENQCHVGTAKIFMFSKLDWPLTHLNCVILYPNNISLVVAFQILNANIPAQDSCAEFIRRAALFAGSRGVARFHRFAFDAVPHMLYVQLETAVVLVIDRHTPSDVVSVRLFEEKNIGHAIV
jgi:hypothetical protein